MKIASWNVNGIRAIAKKGDLRAYFESKDAPDILAMQETKVTEEQLTSDLRTPKDFYTCYNSAEQKGYSGTAVWSKIKPRSIISGYPHPTFDHSLHNKEGRVTGVEFDTFTFFSVYFPNGGKSPEHFEYKFLFYETLFEYFESLRKKGKSLIISGDFNIAHTPLDIARPKENEGSIGFTVEERKLLDKVCARGYIDTFREFCTEGGHYSWWHYFTQSRARNVGWRIDYIFITPELRPHLKSARILDHVYGSDHCPVEIELTCKEDALAGTPVIHESKEPRAQTLF